MLPYYTLDEVAQKSGLTRDQVIRLGFSGVLVFSVRNHAPQNYKETEESKDEDGAVIVRTTTNQAISIVKPPGPALKLVYIAPEDVINIVTNDAPSRKTLVHATYSTREIAPKLGAWRANCPLELTPVDLVVSEDEWNRFSRGPGKKLKNYLPLALPEKVTIRWLLTNLSVTRWVWVGSAIVAIFCFGIFMAETRAYHAIRELFQPE